jgi:hypothetical protein
MNHIKFFVYFIKDKIKTLYVQNKFCKLGHTTSESSCPYTGYTYVDCIMCGLRVKVYKKDKDAKSNI